MIRGLKICGISDPKTLNYILNHPYPPKFIGFITNYKKSKRYVAYENLKNLVEVDKRQTNFVSVLVNPTNELLEKIKNLNFNLSSFRKSFRTHWEQLVTFLNCINNPKTQSDIYKIVGIPTFPPKPTSNKSKKKTTFLKIRKIPKQTKHSNKSRNSKKKQQFQKIRKRKLSETLQRIRYRSK